MRSRLTIVFVLALALRVGYCVVATVPDGSLTPRGYREYIMAGSRLLERGTLVSPLVLDDLVTEPSAQLPPVYVGLVAGVFALLGTQTFASMAVLVAINAIATSLSAVFVFCITRRLANNSAAWVAAILAAINPTLIGFTTFIWDTSLFCLGVTLGVWMSLRLAERPITAWRWLWFGAFLGGLALLNPALTIAYPLLVLWPVCKSNGWQPGSMFRGASFALLGWFIAIMPWTVRNYVQFSELFYIRSGFMLELWLGVCPEADAEGAAVFQRRFPLLNDEVQRRIAAVGERAFVEECGDQARAAITAEPWRMVRLVGIRTVDYYLGTVLSHRRPGHSGWPRSASRAAVATFLLAEVVAVALGLLMGGGRRRDAWWLLAIIVTFSLVYSVTHVQVRFRAPTEPVMAVLIAVLLQQVWTAWIARRADGAPDNLGT